jgi:hypothetical protein
MSSPTNKGKRRSKMKMAMFVMYDVSKSAEVAQASDQVQKTPGYKRLATYLFQGIPFEGIPPNTAVGLSISEVDSNEVLLAVQYPLAIAGASTWNVPVFEVPLASAAKTEEKYRK